MDHANKLCTYLLSSLTSYLQRLFSIFQGRGTANSRDEEYPVNLRNHYISPLKLKVYYGSNVQQPVQDTITNILGVRVDPIKLRGNINAGCFFDCSECQRR